ncbi:Protein of unknown function [Pyronema omphalodes CBS 100304]|uniref:Uncharacterized protein n=1 Tax=Pyronema omphalodes (strain CBS 100304) TaxID=1076935 RepID=U4L2V8_PYROM|nr:Protein of unknown function [Pyronema omphalodes CBS 100304]
MVVRVCIAVSARAGRNSIREVGILRQHRTGWIDPTGVPSASCGPARPCQAPTEYGVHCACASSANTSMPHAKQDGETYFSTMQGGEVRVVSNLESLWNQRHR